MSTVTTTVSYFWRLLALLVLSGVVFFCAFYYWSDLLGWLFTLQKSLNQQLASLLADVKIHPLSSGLLLVGLSFLYGLLHSLGPGHGKVIIMTYLSIQRVYYRRALLLSLFSSLCQGGVAIMLVMGIATLFSLSRHNLGLAETLLEKFSYLIIIGLGLILCYRALKYLLLLKKATPMAAPPFKIIRPIKSASTPLLTAPHRLTPSIRSFENSLCGCGHRHIASAPELIKTDNWRSGVMVVLSIGIRPCTGAILVLIFAQLLEIPWWGILAVLCMSLGTALTIALLVSLVFISKKLAYRLLTQHQLPSWLSLLPRLLLLLGGLLLILLGILLYLTLHDNLSSFII